MMGKAGILTSIGLAELPIAVAIFDLDGTLVALNGAGQLLVGRPVDAVIGSKAWELAPGVEHIWPEIITRAKETGSYRGEIALATPHDSRHIHYLNVLRDHDSATYMVSFALELPADSARNASVAAQQRLEALGLVAGGIAHDFNNQLVSVLAEASAAREDPALPESTRESLRRIETAAHRMAQLTRQLLAYAGRGRFVTEVFDPDELVRQTQEQLLRSVREGAVLRVTTNAGRVAVEADRALLRQVLGNVVANASDALEGPGGTVDVKTRLDGSYWLLEVIDSGAGMDAHTTARIFDPFFTTKPDHHGLGLSAVHGIVRRLGGVIEVDTVLGKGTTIAVRLPLVQGIEPERKRSTSKQPPLPTLRGLRILVADDEPSVRATVKRLLDRRGADVVIAADGAEARDRLGDGTYQLVLLDVMMPELTGYQLLPIARQLQPAAKVMLMSGYSEHTRRLGRDEEPDAFLEKPFTAKVLDHAIDEVLGAR